MCNVLVSNPKHAGLCFLWKTRPFVGLYRSHLISLSKLKSLIQQLSISSFSADDFSLLVPLKTTVSGEAAVKEIHGNVQH